MKRFAKIALLILAGWSLPCSAAAQTTTAGTVRPRTVSPEERDKMTIEQAVMVQGGRLMTTVETRITPGRPYSADAITESLQVLGDGNRISSKRVTRVFRDNDGRTRREQLGDDGNVQTITINDPVGGASYTLNPATKTASQSNVLALGAPTAVAPSGYGRGVGAGGGGAVSTTTVAQGGRGGAAATTTEAKVEERRRQSADAQSRAAVEQAETSRPAAAQAKQVVELAASGRGRPTKEELGEQMIEGVRAIGTRTTTIIPAGSSIGNMNEIRIVSEQWFSPDLEVLVLTKHSDPRVGETTYRLTNIVRAQPDPNLFVLPGDYTLRTTRGGARGRGGIE
jgi:hypothetical protein